MFQEWSEPKERLVVPGFQERVFVIHRNRERAVVVTLQPDSTQSDGENGEGAGAAPAEAGFGKSFFFLLMFRNRPDTTFSLLQ